MSMPIENCNLKFKFSCPEQWDALTLTDDPEIRFCDACRRQVFFCRTLDEAREFAAFGECIAVSVKIERHDKDLQQGERFFLGDDDSLILGRLNS